MKRSAVLVASALGLAGAFFAGAAYAATDARLGEANDSVTRALVLLKAAENGDVKPPFGGHREKAVEFLTRGQAEIVKAIEFANQPPKPPPKAPKPGHGGAPGH